MANLFIVATPIGNLDDITLRALKVLKRVDLILSEDTRVTKKLLEHYQIKTPTLSYHQHSQLKKVEYILQLLKEGRDLALVSDAGTPGISDPGNKLISILVDEFMSNEKLKGSSTHQLINSLTVIPIPGPSALTAAASISGFPMDKFLFLGFPPTKRKRKKFFEEVINSKYPVVFYESPYRIIKTLKELSSLFVQIRGQISENSRVVVCRELTKKFETIYRGKIDEVIQKIEKDKIKGEFVVVVEAPRTRAEHGSGLPRSELRFTTGADQR
jgi:16S rRNA (cytidine1402-2'-O)-methyltransferase